MGSDFTSVFPRRPIESRRGNDSLPGFHDSDSSLDSFSLAETEVPPPLPRFMHPGEKVTNVLEIDSPVETVEVLSVRANPKPKIKAGRWCC